MCTYDKLDGEVYRGSGAITKVSANAKAKTDTFANLSESSSINKAITKT